MPLTVLVWLTLARICRVLAEQLHGPDDGDDPATYLVRQSGPTVDHSLELGIDVHGFCINCCARRCASSRICIFLGEFDGGGLTHNPWVGGSILSGRTVQMNTIVERVAGPAPCRKTQPAAQAKAIRATYQI